MNSGQNVDRVLATINALLEKPAPDMYSHVIKLWTTILETPNFQMKPTHLALVFDHLLPLPLDATYRKAVIRVLKMTLPYLQGVDYRHHPKYKEFMERSIAELMPNLKKQIENIPEWADIWCLYLQVVRKDMARSVQINAFLSVAESGFRSPNTDLRTQSFVCWRKLIEVFAAEGQLQYTKRVRLITVPLQTTASKNLDLATAKFDCWWYLINSISPETSDDHEKCFQLFLNFCFGPLSDMPLDGYVRNSSAVSPGKLYTELKLTVVVALIRIIGEIAPQVKALKLDHPMDDLTTKFNPLKFFLKYRRELIYCCAEATVLVYGNYNLSSDMEATLTRNIWDNIFALIKQDEKFVKSIILVMDAVKALANISTDSQRKGVTAALPIIFECANAAKTVPKGAQALTEFCVNLSLGLNAATAVAEKETMEKSFQDLIVSPFKAIILFANKITFATAVAKELTKETQKCTFQMWKLVWSKLLSALDRSLPIHTEFLKYGLDNHFNEMIKEKELWIFRWNALSKNQYLNSVAQLFKEASKNQVASVDLVGAINFIFNAMDRSFDKNSSPNGIFKLFNAQIERFASTEFAPTFVDTLNTFVKEIQLDQFLVILEDLSVTVNLLKKAPKNTQALESVTNLRKLLRAKCLLMERSNAVNGKIFLSQHKSWICENTTATAASPKMAPPPKKKEDEFVPIRREGWTFNPNELTEHQKEKLKERRDDIPALYNDNSMSQDTRSLQPWAPKNTPVAAAPTDAPPIANDSTKPQPSAFAAALPPKETTTTPTPITANPPPEVSPVAPAADLNDSRSGTPTQRKKSRAQSELNRLTIDTVEGHSVYDKKTRLSRRAGSMENNGKEDTRTSPRKASSAEPQSAKKGDTGKLKMRRNTINGEMKKERTLKPVPESDSIKEQPAFVTPVKAKIKEPESLKEMKMVTPVRGNAPVHAPVPQLVEPPKAVDVAAPDSVMKFTPEVAKPTPLPEKVAVVSKPVEKKPMVEIPVDLIPLEKKTEPKAPSTVVIQPPKVLQTPHQVVVPETEPMTENLPAVNLETVPEAMDVGSESFVEEMNLVVSANNSVNPQRSIVSSPEDLEDANERESTFLNDTVNISPILKEVTQKDTTSLGRELANKVTEAKVIEVLTTPKRGTTEPIQACKENNPTAISTTPHTFFSKMNGRGAQMLQQTKLFQESTPKEKAREEAPAASREDTLARTKAASMQRSSPSTSILRRKRLEEDMDDTYESPAAKRKKVSFSDPPVSATKEFERDHDRDRKALKNSQFRALMRKSRTDSASELNSLKIDSESDDDVEELGAGEGAAAIPADDTKLIEYLHKKYTATTQTGEDTPKLAVSQLRKLTDVLLHCVATNEPAKEEFFQRLMLAMPKEGLHWAVKESSSYAYLNEVKQQMSAGSFNSFVINLLKTDNELTEKLGQEIGQRMDPLQKLKFISSIAKDPLDKA